MSILPYEFVCVNIHHLTDQNGGYRNKTSYYIRVVMGYPREVCTFK